MTTRATNRDKAKEAFRLLNDLFVDLIAAPQAHRLLSLALNNVANKKPAHDAAVVGVNRLCLFHIIMALAKVSELYKKNKDILPEACRADFKALVTRIEDRGILQFRNTVAGHLYDKDTKKPLTSAEVDSRVDVITQGDPRAFFRWVNGEKENPYPTTVVSIVQRARDLLRDEHEFSIDDLK